MWLNGIVTESSPKFTLFWFMNRDVGGVGLNVPSSEPNFLNPFGGGLNFFGGKLNLFGVKLNSRGGELNSLKQVSLYISPFSLSKTSAEVLRILALNLGRESLKEVVQVQISCK